jgi:hypothetical protein
VDRSTNRRRVWLGNLVTGLVRPRCAGCGAVGCVTWGHQYQPLVCQAKGRPSTGGRPELHAMDVNSRRFHVGLFRGWHRVQ